MLKWAAKKLGVGAMEVHLDDLADYIETLSKATPEQKQAITSEVTEFRQTLESKGIEVGTPLDYVQRKPAMIQRIEDYVEETAKTDQDKAMGMAPWMHTLRAAKHIADDQRPEVFRELVLKMWRELGRELPQNGGDGFYPSDFDPRGA